MARKKKHGEEHIDESWLIPYADLLTLLLALFIVLFAASSVDVQKFEQLAQSLSLAFQGGAGFMEMPAPIQPLDPYDSENKKEHSDKDSDDDLGSLDYQELQEIQEAIDTYIEAKNLSFSLQTNLTQRGLIITILDDALFSSGSAEVRADARQLAYEISQLLVTDPPRHITVAGHTDNIPINTFQFRSNWDLSSMRALNFMKLLLENPELQPERFSATGYGEYRPVAPNDSVEGRSKNRRVEILILPFE